MSKMTNSKWLEFWSAAIVFLLMATYFLFQKGVFDGADFVVLGIVGVAFCAVGAVLYLFVKGRT